MVVPWHRLSTVGRRAFAVHGPKWSGTPCLTTSAHSRTMPLLNRAWKPGCSLGTNVHSALETFVTMRYINLHLPLPLPLPSPSDNSNDRWKRLCLVSWAAALCVWTLRALTRNLLTYLLTYIVTIVRPAFSPSSSMWTGTRSHRQLKQIKLLCLLCLPCLCSLRLWC